MTRCSVITVGRLHTDHIAALEGLHGSVTVDRRCEDLPELLAAAQVTRADAVLIIGETERLTRSLMVQLMQTGVRIVAISDAPAERQRLAHLGAVTFDDDVEPKGLADALTGAQRREADRRSPPADEEFSQLMEASGWAEQAEGSPAGTLQWAAGEEAERQGSSEVVTVVWGASGAPGRTTVAVNMAAELAVSGATTLLIDADTYSSSVALHLGLLHESAGLAQACRAAELGRLDATTLAEVVTPVEVKGQQMHVITGLPRPERWTELRSAALEKVIELARSVYDHVVIDTAPWVEQSATAGFEPGPAQRNGCTTEMLRRADRVLALGGADPVGFSRLVKAVQEIGETVPEAAKPQVVVTGVRRSVIGRSPRRQLEQAWETLGPDGPIAAYLPWDRESCDAALRAGEVLAESAADTVLRLRIAALAGVEVHRREHRLRSALRRRLQRSRAVDSHS